jgi:hypothetical protein
VNLATLRDMAELWGHPCDQSGDILKIEESPADYVLIRWTGKEFRVIVHDTPATLLRNLADYLVGTKTPAIFRMSPDHPSTKQRKYGR